MSPAEVGAAAGKRNIRMVWRPRSKYPVVNPLWVARNPVDSRLT
jgi:hypothetical protein